MRKWGKRERGITIPPTSFFSGNGIDLQAVIKEHVRRKTFLEKEIAEQLSQEHANATLLTQQTEEKERDVLFQTMHRENPVFKKIVSDFVNQTIESALAKTETKKTVKTPEINRPKTSNMIPAERSKAWVTFFDAKRKENGSAIPADPRRPGITLSNK
ncbi:MAG: hypothetical protein ACD_42C00404G0001 [uncultured bacterium]|nr:MAG: hypothetical protein ACD_42C00404G0001 [uncultured bacterium]OGT32858.1 MAG: hypothetical protein A3C44_04795 [Gammaproteobacteria bacterium RIFCSPHIGHO2_02_FULL_39_13]OGT50516.1 MAG: hypothetical protein A3E53_03235 [Gammaproteobacteria bacterium RIFCSPHIGHO2_12_FULL_39_24]